MACRHHWLIAPAAGPVSRGVCRECGEEREFYNSVSNHIHKGQTKTIAGLGVSAKRRYEYDADLFHAEALVAEGNRGCRE